MKYSIEQAEAPEVLENHLNLGGKNDVEDIRINSRYLVRNERPWIPIAGEIHYFRLEEEVWEKELLKMKAGGITSVSCYVPWIYHEETEGNFNFSGKRNLYHFLELVQEAGMKAVLRIGPWVHGEIRNGGFPDWLLKKGCALRQNDPEYLVFVRRFYEAVYEQVKEFLFVENGPVWSIQLENELTDQAEHLKTLRNMAEEIGLRAPVYTVTGWNAKYGAAIPEYDVLPVFGGYPEAPWENHTEKLEPNIHYFFLKSRNDSGIGKDLIVQDDDEKDVFKMRYELYPYATCELGGGVQVTHHRRPVMGEKDISAISLVKLGCGNNLPGYYMYHGGTNDISETTLQESKETGYPNDYTIKSYDFQAPLGEYGEVRESYHQLRELHFFIQSFMEKLAPMNVCFPEAGVDNRMDKTSLRFSVRTDGDSGFVFVNNFQRLDRLQVHENVQFEVPCKNGKLVFPKKGMRIEDGAYMILPYNLKLGNILLRYAAAQLLYQKDHNYFFFVPCGESAEYGYEIAGEQKVVQVNPKEQQMLELDDGNGKVVRIITLTNEEAKNFYVLDGDVFLTKGSSLYRKGTALHSYRKGNPELSFGRWDGGAFVWTECQCDAVEKNVSYQEFVPELKDYPYSEELFLDTEKKVRGYIVELTPELVESTEDVLMEIHYTGDVLQIYADRKLLADDFSRGVPKSVSVRQLLKCGDRLEILISERIAGSSYMEAGEDSGLELEEIKLVPVWEKTIDLGAC